MLMIAVKWSQMLYHMPAVITSLFVKIISGNLKKRTEACQDGFRPGRRMVSLMQAAAAGAFRSLTYRKTSSAF